jgi:hypothetical protein
VRTIGVVIKDPDHLAFIIKNATRARETYNSQVRVRRVRFGWLGRTGGVGVVFVVIWFRLCLGKAAACLGAARGSAGTEENPNADRPIPLVSRVSSPRT